MDVAEVVDGILVHYGVKGMKWGVQRRRAQNREIRKAQAEIFKKHNVGRPTTGLRPHDYVRATRATRELSKAKRQIRKPSEVSVLDSGKKLKTKGGHGRPAHPDAIKARTVGQVAKKSGLKSLSNEELQELSKRLNLEQNVKRLQYQDAPLAKKAALTIVGRTGQQQVQDVANQQATKAVAKLMKAKG